MAYITLLIGFVLLLGAGDLLVRGAVAMATRYHVSPLVIGSTIVALGTSAPEFVISLSAVLEGAGAIATGNIVGSNIANVLLVLGLPAMIRAIETREVGLRRNTGFMIAVSVIFTALCFMGPLGLPQGVVLMATLGYFIWQSARQARRGRKIVLDDAITDQPHNIYVIGAFLVGGMIGLPIGAYLTVEGAVAIATYWGVSQTAIGLTVVALGTSLPEVAASVMAAIRREHGIAVGNVIGSNIFNLAGVLGLTAALVEVPVPDHILHLDIWVMLACAFILLPFVIGERRIGRVAGVTFLIAYAAYIIAVFTS